ncbi:MAG: hypothetical protein LBT32_04850 [Peptococcaceae bacterium]|nr:hypothetical protein [Peptococcaceae bacterium]
MKGFTFFKAREREQICARAIVVSIICLLVCVLGVRGMTVDVLDMYFINESSAYVVVTEKETVRIKSTDVLRIERSYAKTVFTGNPIEMDKIYTQKGFIYLSSADTFAETGRQLIDAVDTDPTGETVWIPPKMTLDENAQLARSLDYAIGTPKHYIPLIHLFIQIQVFIFFILILALFFLIFPLGALRKKISS